MFPVQTLITRLVGLATIATLLGSAVVSATHEAPAGAPSGSVLADVEWVEGF